LPDAAAAGVKIIFISKKHYRPSKFYRVKYYKIDSRKISFREYYNLSRAGFLIAWFYRILRIPLELPSGFPEPQPFRHNIVDTSAIPSGILGKLNAGVLDLQKLGFDHFWFHTTKTSLMGGASYGVQALHSSHKTIGKIICVSYSGRQSFLYACISELNNGEVLATTNYRPQFNPPPGYAVFRRPGANTAQTLRLHQNKLAELEYSNPPKMINHLDQVEALEDKILRMSFEDKISRGIWVEMTDAEVEALRARRCPAQPSF
jgi:hypothetical protein